MHNAGHLVVITGPMFATKSQSTRALFEKHCVFGRRGIWVKPDTDNRCNGKTVTHDLRTIADAVTVSASNPQEVLPLVRDYQVIVFDEAQFFSDAIVEVVKLLLRDNKIVIVNGLKLTAGGSIFGAMHHLLAHADEIISLKAVCNVCRKVDSATRTRAYQDNNPTVKVGGSSDYYVVCPECDHGTNSKT